jgi:hypothetical protein
MPGNNAEDFGVSCPIYGVDRTGHNVFWEPTVEFFSAPVVSLTCTVLKKSAGPFCLAKLPCRGWGALASHSCTLHPQAAQTNHLPRFESPLVFFNFLLSLSGLL